MEETHYTLYSDASTSSSNDVGEDDSDLTSKRLRQSLRPVDLDPTDRTRCLSGTRVDSIEDIVFWATDSSEDSESKHQVLWIYGPAGSGKSTLLSTVRDQLFDQNHLGAFYFFDRNYPHRSSPTNVIRTLACQLSSARSGIAAAISAFVEKMPSVVFSPTRVQFQQLLTRPLLSDEALGTRVPLVLVLDALDECGTAEDRRELLELLANPSSFPSDIRIIIASRPEEDIRDAFEHQPHILGQELDITSDVNAKDISLYLRSRLQVVAKEKRLVVGVGWPRDDEIVKLAEKASGFIAWASVASGFINDHNPRSRVRSILSRRNSADALNSLYKMVLRSVSDWKDEEFVADFRAIVGLVLVARTPLSINAIDLLVSPHHPSKSTLDLLSCVICSEPTVRVLHSSFVDFLTSRARCGDIWHINPLTFHRRLTTQCFYRLDRVLKRNPCNLELSRHNVTTGLLKHIEYECVFWIDHVLATPERDVGLARDVENFLRRHFLHWVEAMSILQKSREIIISLGRLLDWIEMIPREQNDFVCFVRDACRFVRDFASSIEEHPLLVYQMVSSFTPTNSPIYQTFHNIPSVPQIAGGFQQSWSPLLLALNSCNTHEDMWVGIHSVSFSPDGRWIAAGSADMTVRVWDTDLGMESLPALRGHTDDVWSVAFSPDGKYIVSGSEDKTIRLWDTSLGSEELEMRGHSGQVLSVAFSPDGTRIVSGSADLTARVWDINVVSRGEPPLILSGHEGPINAVAFSPDGTCIASGSDDTTIRVWDVISDGEIVQIFRGHDDEVTSLAFSPNDDGRRIASGSYDATIRIWDTDTAHLVSILNCGGMILSVSFSPDGLHILSGSYDNKIRIWSAISGAEVVPTLRGHDSLTQSVAFSPDGKRFASGGGFGDPTVLVWDTALCQHTDLELHRHDKRVTVVAFSSDGLRIASGSSDNTIRLWDARSGEGILPVLQGHTSWISSIAFSFDGRRIVSGSHDNTLRIWGPEALLTLEGHSSWVETVAFSPDGMRIVSSSDDGTIRVWDASSGQEVVSPMPKPYLLILSVQFSPDGTRIILRSHSQAVSWSAESEDRTCEMEQYSSLGSMSSIHLSPDGWIEDDGSLISKLPPVIKKTSSATHQRSLVIGTTSGHVLIMHFPSEMAGVSNSRHHIRVMDTTDDDEYLSAEN